MTSTTAELVITPYGAVQGSAIGLQEAEAGQATSILPCLLRAWENKWMSFLANHFWGLTNKMYF